MTVQAQKNASQKTELTQKKLQGQISKKCCRVCVLQRKGYDAPSPFSLAPDEPSEKNAVFLTLALNWKIESLPFSLDLSQRAKFKRPKKPDKTTWR